MAVFPIQLVMILLPIAILGAVLGVAAGRGRNLFKRQSVAWVLTAMMVVAAIGIGYAKAPIHNPAPEPNLPAPTIAPGAPAESFHVWDNANVLSAQTERELSQRNTRLWNSYSVSIGVVTCNYGRDDLYEYTVKKFEEMGLGDYDMLVVLDIRGDNYWLYTGDGVAWDFSDEDSSDYLYDYLEGYFARGAYGDGVLRLTEMLEAWYGAYYG